MCVVAFVIVSFINYLNLYLNKILNSSCFFLLLQMSVKITSVLMLGLGNLPKQAEERREDDHQLRWDHSVA